MLPAGPLMKEHRLIERMIPLLQAERKRISSTNEPDADFLMRAVDFFRTYADRCHHGKEEDILFAELEKMTLQEDHARVMKELMDEHVLARTSVRGLIDARKRFLDGEASAAEEIMALIDALVELYPMHIEKEDKDFFIPVMDYFPKKAQLDMLHRFFDFDEHLVHNVYRDVVEFYEGEKL
jgi:hemerythrin-like domain-containing protein